MQISGEDKMMAVMIEAAIKFDQAVVSEISKMEEEGKNSIDLLRLKELKCESFMGSFGKDSLIQMILDDEEK